MQNSGIESDIRKIQERPLEGDFSLCTASGSVGAVHIPRLKRQEIQLTEAEELSMGIC